MHPRAPPGAQAVGSFLKGPPLPAPTRLDTDLLSRDGGSVTPGWLLGAQHAALEPLGSSLGWRLLTASAGQDPLGAAASAPPSPSPGGLPGAAASASPAGWGVSQHLSPLTCSRRRHACGMGVRVTREHSTPERVSPVRAARHWLHSPACAWLVSRRGPAGPGPSVLDPHLLPTLLAPGAP